MKWLISFWIHSVESSYCAEYALKNILESKNLNPQNQLRRKSSIDKSLSFHSSSELLTIFWFVRLDFSHQSDIGTCKRVRCSKQCLTNRRIDALSKREVFFDSFMHLLWEQNLLLKCAVELWLRALYRFFTQEDWAIIQSGCKNGVKRVLLTFVKFVKYNKHVQKRQKLISKRILNSA